MPWYIRTNFYLHHTDPTHKFVLINIHIIAKTKKILTVLQNYNVMTCSYKFFTNHTFLCKSAYKWRARACGQVTTISWRNLMNSSIRRNEKVELWLGFFCVGVTTFSRIPSATRWPVLKTLCAHSLIVRPGHPSSTELSDLATDFSSKLWRYGLRFRLVTRLVIKVTVVKFGYN